MKTGTNTRVIFGTLKYQWFNKMYLDSTRDTNYLKEEVVLYQVVGKFRMDQCYKVQQNRHDLAIVKKRVERINDSGTFFLATVEANFKTYTRKFGDDQKLIVPAQPV